MDIDVKEDFRKQRKDKHNGNHDIEHIHNNERNNGTRKLMAIKLNLSIHSNRLSHVLRVSLEKARQT